MQPIKVGHSDFLHLKTFHKILTGVHVNNL